MKLEKQFSEILINTEFSSKDAKKCVEIANAHAIGFAEWKDKIYLDGKIGLVDRGFVSYDNGKTIEQVTTAELLELYNTSN